MEQQHIAVDEKHLTGVRISCETVARNWEQLLASKSRVFVRYALSELLALTWAFNFELSMASASSDSSFSIAHFMRSCVCCSVCCRDDRCRIMRRPQAATAAMVTLMDIIIISKDAIDGQCGLIILVFGPYR